MICQSRAYRALAWLTAGELDEAEPLLEEALESLRRTNMLRETMIFEAVRGVVEASRGRFDSAEKALAVADALVPNFDAAYTVCVELCHSGVELERYSKADAARLAEARATADRRISAAKEHGAHHVDARMFVALLTARLNRGDRTPPGGAKGEGGAHNSCSAHAAPRSSISRFVAASCQLAIPPFSTAGCRYMLGEGRRCAPANTVGQVGRVGLV